MNRIFSLTSALLLMNCALLFSQSNDIGAGITLLFDGTKNSYVDLGDNYNSLNFPFTFEAWVNQSPPQGGSNILFASDNSTHGYSGFIVLINTAGLVDFEFANNTGEGATNRRGVVSVPTVPLGTWVHVACVAYSPGDMRIYLNGVRAKATLSGNSELKHMVSNNSHAFIGRREDPYGTYSYNGHIDEIRLWNVVRSETDIRKNMCAKADPLSAGLIGYWKADEAYNTPTVEDYSASHIDGTIFGSVSKITSGAPIGNESRFSYSTSWDDVKLKLAGTDTFQIRNIQNAAGVYIYRVDHAPYYTFGLSNYPAYYFGVFCIPDGGKPGYRVNYRYSQDDGVVNAMTEDSVTLRKRTDASFTKWSLVASRTDTISNTITSLHQTVRGEYILNVPVSESKSLPYSEIENNRLFIRPNITSSSIKISLSNMTETISSVCILDVTGTIVQEMKNLASDQVIPVDVSVLAPGIYLVEARTASGLFAGRFQVVR